MRSARGNTNRVPFEQGVNAIAELAVASRPLRVPFSRLDSPEGDSLVTGVRSSTPHVSRATLSCSSGRRTRRGVISGSAPRGVAAGSSHRTDSGERLQQHAIAAGGQRVQYVLSRSITTNAGLMRRRYSLATAGMAVTATL